MARHVVIAQDSMAQINQTKYGAPFPVSIGIDEIETGGKAGCHGWTYFCIPEVYAAEFEKEAASLLPSSGLRSFHGKEYKRRFDSSYGRFLQLMRNYIDKSFQTRCGSILYTPDHKTSIVTIGESILIESLQTISVDRNAIFDVLRPYVPPLICLTEFADWLGPNIKMKVEMDEHQKLKGLSLPVVSSDGQSVLLQSETHIWPSTVSAIDQLTMMYNKYASNKSLRLPLLSPNGVRTMDDRNSYLIQAADIFGNFSLAFTRVKLGRSSDTQQAKAKLIYEVFGDRMDLNEFTRYVRLEQEDLILSEGRGIVKCVAGWTVKSNPGF